MNKNIALFSFIFITFFGILGVPEAYARTVATCDSAEIKGYVTVTYNNPTTVWFEWGEGKREYSGRTPRATPSQRLTRSGSFSDVLDNLKPNTDYHFRAVAQNRDGVVEGDLETFKTANCVAQAPQVIYSGAQTSRNTSMAANAFYAQNYSYSNNYNAYQNMQYRTFPIASSSASSASSNSFAYVPAPHYANNMNMQYSAQQYYNRPVNNLNANALDAINTLPFSLAQLVVFLIIIFAIAFVFKRILAPRTY